MAEVFEVGNDYVVFTILVVVLKLVEHAIKGLWTGNGLAGGFAELLDRGPHELLAGSLVIFVALIPFFFRQGTWAGARGGKI